MKLSKDSIARLSYEPGQYFFVNIPEISLNEWHPFTATAILDDGIVFCIKRLKTAKISQARTWTQRLADIAQASSDPDKPKEETRTSSTTPSLALRLSGPFGHTNFTSYEKLLLVAGGIGITPMIAIFAHLKKRQLLGHDIGKLKHVQLVWMSRSVGEFSLFEKVLSLLAEDGRNAMKKRRASAMNPYITPETATEYTNSCMPFGTNSTNIAAAAHMTEKPAIELEVACISKTVDPDAEKFPSPVFSENESIASQHKGMEKEYEIHNNAMDQSLLPPGCMLSPSEPQSINSSKNTDCSDSSPMHALSPPKLSSPANASVGCDFRAPKKLSVASFGEQDDLSIACRFELSLFCTRRASFAALSDPQSADFVNLFLHNGRCNIKETFESMGMRGSSCMAAVCGPVPLMLDVSDSARTTECDFHSEQFLF